MGIGESVEQNGLEDLNDNIAWLDNMITNNDKRRHPRRRVALKGDLALLKKLSEGMIEFEGGNDKAGVLDMSVSGAGIVTKKEMNMGQRCKVTCPLKGGKLSLNLKVVRFSKLDQAFRYGCEMSLVEKTA